MELAQLGWNLLTLGFIGTLATTLLQGWGSCEQAKQLWHDKSAQSVSTRLFAYVTLVFIATFIYGVATKSIALIFNGLLAFAQVLVLVGIWKFRGFTKKEIYLLCAVAVVSVIMIFLPGKDWFFLMISFGSVFFLIDQPWEIYRNRNSGSVSIKMYIAYLISTTFWTFYAFTIHDWVLEIMCPSYFVVLSFTTLLWYKYRKPTLSSPTTS